MEDYYQQSIRALQLAGMSERTQECYTRVLRLLVDFHQKTPDLITEPELEDYFLHRRNTDKWSAATLGIAYSGIIRFGWFVQQQISSRSSYGESGGVYEIDA